MIVLSQYLIDVHHGLCKGYTVYLYHLSTLSTVLRRMKGTKCIFHLTISRLVGYW